MIFDSLQHRFQKAYALRGISPVSAELSVNQFWIYDFGFWIDPTRKGIGIKDFRLAILDYFRPRLAEV